MINAFVIFVAIILGSLFGYVIFLIKTKGFKIPEIKIFKWRFFGKQYVDNPNTRVNKVLNNPELLYQRLTTNDKGEKVEYLNHGKLFKVELIENKDTGEKHVEISESATTKHLKRDEEISDVRSTVLPIKKLKNPSEIKHEKQKKSNRKKSKKANKETKKNKVS